MKNILLVVVVVLLAASSGLLSSAEQMAHIQTDADVLTHVPYAEVKCGGRITIDSLSAIIPAASTSSPYLPYYPNGDEPNSGEDYVTFSTRTISASLGRLVEDTLSSSMTSVILFEVDASSMASGSVCDVYWDPRSSWLFGGIELSSITLATIESEWSGGSSQTSCPVTTFGFAKISGIVSLDSPSQILSTKSTNPLQLTSKITALNGRMFADDQFGADTVFPVTVLAPGGCKLTYALIASHHGKYTSLGKWLPLVIYTVLFVPVMLIRGRRHIREGSTLGHISVCLAFIGFTGCCAGLSIELASWHYPLRPFPFPSGVTMFLCSAVGYALVLMGLLYRHPSGSVATFSAMHMLLYGMSMGLLVGYFFRHLLVIGCIAIAMIVLTNLMMTVLAARFTASLPNSFRTHTGSSSMSSMLSWFPFTAPVMPVSHLALQVTWSGIPALHEDMKKNNTMSVGRAGSVGGADRQDAQMEVVRLHSVSASVLMMLLHHTSTLALLLAACIYHAPFVVALFPVLVVISLHVAYTAQEYSTAWRRWGKVSLWVGLETALHQYARHEAEVTPSRYVHGEDDGANYDDANYTPKGDVGGYDDELEAPRGQYGVRRMVDVPPSPQVHRPIAGVERTSSGANSQPSLSRRGASPPTAEAPPKAPYQHPTFRTVAHAAVAGQRMASQSGGVRSGSAASAVSQQQTAEVLRAREAAFLRRMEADN